MTTRDALHVLLDSVGRKATLIIGNVNFPVLIVKTDNLSDDYLFRAELVIHTSGEPEIIKENVK